MMVLGYAGRGEHRGDSQVTSKISEISYAWLFDVLCETHIVSGLKQQSPINDEICSASL